MGILYSSKMSGKVLIQCWNRYSEEILSRKESKKLLIFARKK